ncbi:DHA2 family efflux MFS transporter permease subunit [Kibdelosporangium phytohabitans]|uniref:DHA2 family efflux MFS transporter permease subunit n=1 Tax=Kibdelosporangium phytohabitans TaxID=860235 RepID=UPI0009F8D006|nr:DHA2 family efflux MFS transporter permease subunit [Kibdelosporangium phytohabitans]MBE1461925.1 EmrB/QacA subfamily drug resistance transporter [Kibdelosporangium phytohabitans]
MSVRPWRALLVLCVANFLVLLDTTIVNTAAPSIMGTIGAGLDDILWVINGYLIVFAALLIPFGRLGDRIGPRTLFVAGLALFVATSVLCALAPGPGWLVAFRVGQGLGAAMLVPQSLVLISAIFPANRRGAAFGIFTAVAGIAAVAGPILGGLLIEHLGWPSVFLLNVPIGLAGIAGALRVVPRIRPGGVHRFDVVGVALITLCLTGFVYALVETGASWLYAGSALMLVLFVVWERRHPEPLVPFTLYRDRGYAVATVITFVTSYGTTGFLLVFVLHTQNEMGMDALSSGVSALPWTLALSAVAPIAGRFADRFDGRFLLGAGVLVFAAGVFSFPQSFTWPLIAIGVGQGLAIAPTTTLALRYIPAERAGAASGVLNTARQIGAAVGAALAGAVLLAFSAHAALIVLSATLLAAAPLSLLLQPHGGIDGAHRTGHQPAGHQRTVPVPPEYGEATDRAGGNPAEGTEFPDPRRT